MGLLKTSKLDNGEIAFECIYGGLEAPFGGIDASKAPRYIDPRCFADASNFLLIDNELCLSSLQISSLPPVSGFTYPISTTSTSPGVLLGVGRLPCEGLIKSWALYVSPAADTSNFWHYRLVLWNSDTPPTVESYDFSVSGQTQTFPATSATATLTVSYADSFSAIQSAPEFPLLLSAGGTQNPPYALGAVVYEAMKYLFNIGGVPTNNLYPGYGANSYASNFFGNTQISFFSGKPSGTLPGLADIAAIVTGIIHTGWTNGYYPFDATHATGSSEIVLTAKTPTNPAGAPYYPVEGNVGNAITLSGGSLLDCIGYYPSGGGSFVPVVGPTYGPITPFPFTIPSFNIEFNPFQGGKNAYTYQQQPIQNLTWETVGDNLYLAGYPANYMLQFNNSTKHFGYLTQYEGARVLKKMAGHLISVGLINGLDNNSNPTNFADPHLWFSWSAPQNVSQWSAVDSNGLVTGAGGSQLGDISDMLTGLVVSNSVAFILREAGLSYASVQTGITIPFSFNHVALCKDGQGCPSTNLWTQFDQLGFYVGATNVFMLQQGPQAIGDKIVETLFPQLLATANRISDLPPFSIIGNPPPMQDKYYGKVNVEPLTFPQSNRIVTQFAVNIAGIIFMYDPQDGTWMKLDTGPVFQGENSNVPIDFKWSILKCISLYKNGATGYGGSYQSKESYVYGQAFVAGLNYQAPLFYQLVPFMSRSQNAHIWFPVEEISFGRDITIDAIYVLASGIPGLEVDVTIDGYQNNPETFLPGVFSGKLIFNSSAAPNIYQEYQVFNSDGSAVTVKAPQLKFNVIPTTASFVQAVPYPIASDAYVKIAKVAMFGKFDPAQRPV